MKTIKSVYMTRHEDVWSLSIMYSNGSAGTYDFLTFEKAVQTMLDAEIETKCGK